MIIIHQDSGTCVMKSDYPLFAVNRLVPIMPVQFSRLQDCNSMEHNAGIKGTFSLVMQNIWPAATTMGLCSTISLHSLDSLRECDEPIEKKN